MIGVGIKPNNLDDSPSLSIIKLISIDLASKVFRALEREMDILIFHTSEREDNSIIGLA